MATVFLLLLPLVLFGAVGFIVVYSTRRLRQGKKPRTGLMVAGTVVGLVGVSWIAQTIATGKNASGREARAKKSADALLSALSHGDTKGARALLAPDLAQRVDLSKWRLAPGTHWRLVGKGVEAKSVQLFYLVEHEPVDRQTVFFTFVEHLGREQLSKIQRTYHLPRPVLVLGEKLLSTLAQSGSNDVAKAFPGLDRSELERLRAILRSAPAPRWRVASYRQPLITSIGNVQYPPRIWVRWEISAGGKESTIVLYFVMQASSLVGRRTWRMARLSLSGSTPAPR